ncbi:MAG: hypothetical protein AB1847_22870 [bacterium]
MCRLTSLKGQGQRSIARLKRIKERFASSQRSIIWDGKDNSQQILPPGVYNLRIKAADLLGNVTVMNGPAITIASYLGEGPMPEEVSSSLSRMRLFRVAPTESSDPKNQINPAIDLFGTIVWQDYRNGNWDIYQCSGSRVIRITTDPAPQENPAVYGDTVVWQDYRSGDWDIYYKVGIQAEVGIVLPQDQINPCISGNRIVFESDGNIYLYTIGTIGGQIRQITSHVRDQGLPRIDGDIIVWQDSRFGDPLIYAYDIAHSTEMQITPIDEENHTRHINPCVSGGYIMWADNRSGNYDICQYRISDGSTQRLTFGPTDQTRPYIFGSHFVYSDHNAGSDDDAGDDGGEGNDDSAGNGNEDIAFGSTISFISERVVIDSAQQQNPCLSGTGPYTIVWQDNRSGHWEIYRGLLDHRPRTA